jgi:hypothetical protein
MLVIAGAGVAGAGAGVDVRGARGARGERAIIVNSLKLKQPAMQCIAGKQPTNQSKTG